MLTSTVETEIEAQHLCIAALQRIERLLDLIGQEAIHRLIFRIRQVLGDEALDERAATAGVERRIAPHVARVERGERLPGPEQRIRRLADLLGERECLLPREQGSLGDLVQILVEDVALVLVRAETREQTAAPAATLDGPSLSSDRRLRLGLRAGCSLHVLPGTRHWVALFECPVIRRGYENVHGNGGKSLDTA